MANHSFTSHTAAVLSLLYSRCTFTSEAGGTLGSIDFDVSIGDLQPGFSALRPIIVARPTSARRCNSFSKAAALLQLTEEGWVAQ